jgi:hypothetical protein
VGKYKIKVENDVILSIGEEISFKNDIEKRWRVILESLQGKYSSLDYQILLYNPYKVPHHRYIGYIELKCRKYKSTDFKDSMIDLQKWEKIKEYYNETKSDILLGVRYTDVDLYYKYNPNDEEKIVVRKNSGPNNKRGVPDTKTTVGIPLSLFKQIKEQK